MLSKPVSILLSLALISFQTINAQVGIVDPNTAPICALTCAPFIAAQTACVPGSATFSQCFCQSPTLLPLITAPVSVCPQCPADQLPAVQGWFRDVCRQPQTTTSGPAAGGPQTSATTSATGAGNTATNEAGTLSGDNANDNDGKGAAPGSWLDHHWRWVVMIIVIAVGLIGIAVAGILIKRHYRKKRDLAGANVSAHETRHASNSVTQLPSHNVGGVLSRKNKNRNNKDRNSNGVPLNPPPPPPPPMSVLETHSRRNTLNSSINVPGNSGSFRTSSPYPALSGPLSYAQPNISESSIYSAGYRNTGHGFTPVGEKDQEFGTNQTHNHGV